VLTDLVSRYPVLASDVLTDDEPPLTDIDPTDLALAKIIDPDQWCVPVADSSCQWNRRRYSLSKRKRLKQQKQVGRFRPSILRGPRKPCERLRKYNWLWISDEICLRFLRPLNAIPEPFRTAVFLDGASGLRVGELLGLKWEDVDFKKSVIYIRRSIVKQRIGPPKTEASQKPIPMNSELAKALRLWKMKTIYNGPSDWVYASPAKKGTQPYWPKSIYRVYIKRAADKIGLRKRIGWHNVWDDLECQWREPQSHSGAHASC
jgi:integrase